jgi:hypothetical protein
MAGLYNLAVGFEITHIDYEHKQIEFSYIEGGKAKGVQTLRFSETKAGTTKLVHQTYFKSHSNFRDRFFYPRYHKKVINEFHKNVVNKWLNAEVFEAKKETPRRVYSKKPAI